MRVVFRVNGAEVVVEAEPGRTLAELAFEGDIPLNTACGGNGVCERCAVVLHEGAFVIGTERCAVEPGGRRDALACQTRPAGGRAVVEVPAASLLEERAQIHDDFVLPPHLHSPRTKKYVADVPAPDLGHAPADVERLEQALRRSHLPDGRFHVPLPVLRRLPAALREGGGRVTATVGPCGGRLSILALDPGDTSAEHLAVAIDVGTTTVVCALVDMTTGRILARAAQYNQQIRKADDVASRISLSREPEDLDRMRRLIVEDTLNPLIHKVCARAGVAPATITRLAASGNSVMIHLLLGLPPEGIGAIPFATVVSRHEGYAAREIGLDVSPTALLDLVPSMSGYVGGDITSDVYASQLLERHGLHLLVDIGTNGEMALWDGRRLRVAATAAGPAFEGAGLRHGCRASHGAIEHVRCESGAISWATIGRGRPIGICGSGIVDLVAQFLGCGLLTGVGRFDVDALRAAGRLTEIEGSQGAVRACRIAGADETETGQAIVLTEADVAEVLKAKAAVFAGTKTLLQQCGKSFKDLDSVVLAGGFARHLNLRHAAWIGLLPDLPVERFHVIGNGSLAGAYLALVDARAFDAFDAIVRKAEVVELNLTPQFEANFVDALMLPGMDESEFPAAMAEMGRG